ncbi:MAG: LLM class flavin-dependent oxidoreductase [Chloroflexi bacterium]|nr:LLM class flavin-dependent oxidoreductase [Chloroflexota bacterium]
MRAGVVLYTQNPGDFERFAERGPGPPPVADSQAYDEELALGELVEPLGFDSLWCVEHHFTPINLTPNALQFLTFFAGRTRRIDFGTMVVVLPWHNPIRVAEEVSILDNLLEGRKLTIGVGRGAARREFDGLQIAMGESRDRFKEGLAFLRGALTNAQFTPEGQFYSGPQVEVRPRPRSSDLTDRMYLAGVSPETLQIAADEDLGLLLLGQKPWRDYPEDIARYQAIRAEHGWGPRWPTIVLPVVCSESETDAEERAQRHFGEQQDSTTVHYEFGDAEHFRAAGNYQHYVRIAEAFERKGEDDVRRDAFKSQIWGTPEQCIEKIENVRKMTAAGELVMAFKFGKMTGEEALANMRLFASEVLPYVKAMPDEPTWEG